MIKASGPRILIVEDGYFIAVDLAVMLARNALQVIEMTGSHARVVELLVQNAFDIAIVDLDLGHGACFRIARLLVQARIDFLLLTGDERGRVDHRFSRFPILSKPVDERRLVAALRQLLAESRPVE